MDGSEKFWLGIWTVTASIIISIALCITIGCYKTVKLYVENGYTKETLLGRSMATWVKK